MKKKSTKVIVEIAIFAALAFALDALQGGIWKSVFHNGGSIGLAMLPILIICYRRGLGAGIACGLIVSCIQTLGGVYVIQGQNFENPFLRVCGPFLQVALDYLLAYTVVGFAGVFMKKYQKTKKISFIIAGSVLGGLLKYLCHFLSGVIFWPGEMWGVKGAWYSLLYNGLYCIPNIILCTILLVIFALKYNKLIMPEDFETVKGAESNEQEN